MTNIKRVERQCLECKQIFLADRREVTRGNAKFCSISCSVTNINRQRGEVTLNLICIHCGAQFISAYKFREYCSTSCKLKHYRFRKRPDKLRQSTEIKCLQSLPCEICGWKEATRDIHHIINVKDNGTDDLSNLVALCPNHHRMAHRKLLSQDDLLKIAQSRTISSSVELTTELGALAGN